MSKIFMYIYILILYILIYICVIDTKNRCFRLSSLASKPVAAEATGFFVIDPAEDCAAMGDVRQLLTSWSSHGQVPTELVKFWWKRMELFKQRKVIFGRFGWSFKGKSIPSYDRRTFRSQTSDNMDRWKSRGGKESEERRCRCAKS